MLEDYLEIGSVEVANHARLHAYLSSVSSSLTWGNVCRCPTFEAAALGDPPYVSPEVDPAPWWDPDVPASAEYAGFLVLSVEGLDSWPMTRTVTNAVGGGGAFGRARVQAREITVQGLILGASCCGVEYGLHWISEALAGCAETGCGGDCLTLYLCCPPERVVDEESPGSPEDSPDDSPGDDSPGDSPGWDPWESPWDPDEEPEGISRAEYNRRYRRTLRRVALTEGPQVVSRVGDGCGPGGACGSRGGGGADIITVEFTLTAATPWLWTDPTVVLDAPVPRDDDTECVIWCVHSDEPPETLCVDLTVTPCDPRTSIPVEFTDDPTPCAVAWPAVEPPEDPCGVCRLASCPDPRAACADPSCSPAAPPVPEPPATCFCSAIAVNTACYELDLSGRAGWSADAPMITVRAGESDLRRLTITFYERLDEHEGMTCEQVAANMRCNPHSVYEIGFVPAGATLTLDGQIGRALVECEGVCETSTSVWGASGSPPSWRLLDCDRYVVEIAADAIFLPAEDASLTIAVSGRGY